MAPPPRLYATDLTDAEWAILEPPPQPRGRQPKWPPRLIVDGACSVVRSGCQRRLLPREFPPRQTVSHYLPTSGHFEWFRLPPAREASRAKRLCLAQD